MDDRKKDKVVTPLASPHEPSPNGEAPKTVDTDDAPVSTEKDGERVDLPDLGGKID